MDEWRQLGAVSRTGERAHVCQLGGISLYTPHDALCSHALSLVVCHLHKDSQPTTRSLGGQAWVVGGISETMSLGMYAGLLL